MSLKPEVWVGSVVQITRSVVEVLAQGVTPNSGASGLCCSTQMVLSGASGAALVRVGWMKISGLMASVS